MIELVVIFLNIAFLGLMALRDVRTHTVPYYATFIYVICSLLLTNPLYLLQAMMLCLVMYGYVGGKVLHIGNGDRKIIFGLTLQLGWLFGLTILAFIFVVVILKRLQDDKQPVPLVPVILIAYIVMVLYKIGVENFA
jgi:hypothetical protein